MKPSRLFLFLVCIYFSYPSLMAQNSSSGRVGGLEIGAGINTFGPAAKMGELMSEYGFNQLVMDWVAFDQIQYPVFAPTGIGFQASYIKNLSYGKSIGLTMQYSRLRKVSGYSSVSGPLHILFSSFILTPTYTQALGQYIELRGGPALMVNGGQTTDLYEENVSPETERRLKVAPGLFAGINFWVWNIAW